MLIEQEKEAGAQKLFMRFGLFSFIIFFLPTLLFGGSFSEFKRTQTSGYESFQDKQDKQFYNYLKRQWSEYESYTLQRAYAKPKPKSLEILSKVSVKPIGPRIDIPLKKIPDRNITNTLVEDDIQDLFIDFFGAKVGLSLDSNIKKLQFYPRNQTGIMNSYKLLAQSEYGTILEKVRSLAKELQLNDWGIDRLVTNISKELYPQPDEQNILKWFLLNKLGYDVKIALLEKHPVVLQNTKQVVYAKPRYEIDGKYYYILEYDSKESIGSIYTYDHHYPNADKELDFRLTQTPLFLQDIKTKELTFKNYNSLIKFTLQINKNLVDFMRTYPKVSYDIYFNAALDTEIYSALSNQLRKHLNGKKALYGLNFLLHFVQKTFLYERDQEQFGQEKVMFAEETLFYDGSDCEDRAILFAKLVKKLLGYPVVGVQYSNHINTALYIPVEGDSVEVNSKRYVIADPTYINANVGTNMPRYKTELPQAFIKVH